MNPYTDTIKSILKHKEIASEQIYLLINGKKNQRYDPAVVPWTVNEFTFELMFNSPFLWRINVTKRIDPVGAVVQVGVIYVRDGILQLFSCTELDTLEIPIENDTVSTDQCCNAMAFFVAADLLKEDLRTQS
jgi:hypothetical protein